MPETVEAPPSPLPAADPMSPKANRAVAHCCAAFDTARRVAVARKADRFDAREEAREAFREAMPALDGVQNVRDFIACVAYGMLIEAISGSDGARLLYAAQVAQTALRTPPGPQNPST